VQSPVIRENQSAVNSLKFVIQRTHAPTTTNEQLVSNMLIKPAGSTTNGSSRAIDQSLSAYSSVKLGENPENKTSQPSSMNFSTVWCRTSSPTEQNLNNVYQTKSTTI